MHTFLDYYQQEIQPQIAAIDLFLKTEEPPYESDIVAELLDIPSEEWEQILQKEKISFITRGIFFQLMKRGSSPLCGMFRRAVQLGLPVEYTAETAACVFDLELSTVQRAAQETGVTTFTEEMLPQIFSKILIDETRYR